MLARRRNCSALHATIFRSSYFCSITSIAAAPGGCNQRINIQSSVLDDYTVTPPIKPWPQKLTPKRLCSIITQQQNLDLALQIFDYAGKYHPNFAHNYDTYNAMIHKLSRAREFGPVALLLRDLRDSGVTCGENLFISLIRNYGIDSNPRESIRTFLHITDFGVKRSVRSLNTLLNALVQNKRYDSVYLLFKNSKKKFNIVPNVFTCNILLKALCKKNDLEGALKLLDEMPAMGIVPNVVSYTTLMAGYVDRGDMNAAKAVFDEIVYKGCLPDATTYTVLIDGFCKLGKFVEATQVMDEMEENRVEPNDVTYSVMIEALCKQNKPGEAMNMVNDMLDKKYVPSSSLCCKVVDALCRDGKVAQASQLWRVLLLKNCTPDNSILSTLVYWLCKEDQVWEARKLFDEFEKGCIPSLVAYNTLIAGMCDKGELCEAGRLWDQMVARGCLPSSFTYDMLIQCFCKAGFAKFAMGILEEMYGRGFTPSEATYCKLILGLFDSGNKDDVLCVLRQAASAVPSIWNLLLEKVVADHRFVEVDLEGLVSN